jgi:hypothetical protein
MIKPKLFIVATNGIRPLGASTSVEKFFTLARRAETGKVRMI